MTILEKRVLEYEIPEIGRNLKRIAEVHNYDKSEWLGKEVQIYPGDTHSKWGRIVGMNAHGVTFLITKYNGNDKQWPIGKHKFISYSAKLSFVEI